MQPGLRQHSLNWVKPQPTLDLAESPPLSGPSLPVCKMRLYHPECQSHSVNTSLALHTVQSPCPESPLWSLWGGGTPSAALRLSTTFSEPTAPLETSSALREPYPPTPAGDAGQRCGQSPDLAPNTPASVASLYPPLAV